MSQVIPYKSKMESSVGIIVLLHIYQFIRILIKLLQLNFFSLLYSHAVVMVPTLKANTSTVSGSFFSPWYEADFIPSSIVDVLSHISDKDRSH